MKVKAFNLDRLWSKISQESLSAIDATLSTGNVRNNTELEQELKHHTNRKYVIATSTGTDALTIILRSLNYPKGTEILVPCYSFIATASAVLWAGYKPVFVDIDNNYHLDLNKVTITKNTRALVLVSLFGNPANYPQYQRFCDDNGIDLVEDAAQSFGSELFRRSGSVGVASALSFSPTKPCPVLGSGGAIATDSEELYELCRRIRLHGKTKNSDESHHLGMHSVMGGAESAQLLIALKYKDEWQSRRTEIAQYYNDNLPMESPPEQGIHNWHKYVIQADDKLLDKCIQSGVELQKHYKRLISDEPLFNDTGFYDNAERLRKCSVSLPICPMMADNEVERVVEVLCES